MPKRATLAIGGALAALLLLACGDDRLAPEEYFPRVQAIADDVNDTVGAGAEQLAAADPAASEATLVAAVRDFFATLVDALDDAVVALSDLSAAAPPADAEDAHYAFTAEALALAEAFDGVSDRLAAATGFDELNAVLETLDPSFGLDAEFIAACEGLERAAADAGQSLDMQCALDLIPEDAFAVANPAAGYFAALQVIADDVAAGVLARADAFNVALGEAGDDADAQIDAMRAFFTESALAFDETAAGVAALLPPTDLHPIHGAFVEELGNMASQLGELGWRIGGAADLDEVNAILESAPAALGQPPEFVAACEALERAAADAGSELNLYCGAGG